MCTERLMMPKWTLLVFFWEKRLWVMASEAGGKERKKQKNKSKLWRKRMSLRISLCQTRNSFRGQSRSSSVWRVSLKPSPSEQCFYVTAFKLCFQITGHTTGKSSKETDLDTSQLFLMSTVLMFHVYLEGN